jgi:hypothetical protein
MGSGVVFFDYNNDGWPDLFFVNSRDWTLEELAAYRDHPWADDEKRQFGREHGVNAKLQRIIPSFKPQRSTLVLYRNNRDGTFTDVTKSSGIDKEIYGMGAAAADYDGDGWTDVFVTGWPHCYLFRNRSGKFHNVTRETGVEQEGWGTSAAWLDYDGDGWLDLFVCHYVDWSPARDVWSVGYQNKKGYARPEYYAGLPCRLFRNRAGRFFDVSAASGISVQRNAEGKIEPRLAKALGVSTFDWNGDGKLDILVTNDMLPNFLFENTGKGSFREVGMQAGIALGPLGKPRAGMGVDTVDLHHTGQETVVVGNFIFEMLGVYEKINGVFTDTAPQSSVGAASYRFLTFGVASGDLNNDGWLDVVIANGHINDDAPQMASPGEEVFYEQRTEFFANRGGSLHAVGAFSGPDMQRRIVGRGLALADYDLDGDVDVVATHNGGSPQLLRNDSAKEYPSGAGAQRVLRLVLQGRAPNRNAIGALVQADAGGPKMRRWVRTGSSYLSQSELPLTLGMGKVQQVNLSVKWPSGRVTQLKNVATNQFLIIKEARGLIKRGPLPGRLR